MRWGHQGNQDGKWVWEMQATLQTAQSQHSLSPCCTPQPHFQTSDLAHWNGPWPGPQTPENYTYTHTQKGAEHVRSRQCPPLPPSCLGNCAGERTENSGVDVFCSTIHFNLTTAEMRTPMTEWVSNLFCLCPVKIELGREIKDTS